VTGSQWDDENIGRYSVAFGRDSTARSFDATVSGGRGNTVTGNFATVAGGDGNFAQGDSDTVGGGAANSTSRGPFQQHVSVLGGGVGFIIMPNLEVAQFCILCNEVRTLVWGG